MDKRIIIGVVLGLVFGILESIYFYEGSAFTDVTIMTTLLGALVGFASTRGFDNVKYFGISAILGIALFLIVAARSGMFLDDIVTGLVSGLVLGGLVKFISEKLAASA